MKKKKKSKLEPWKQEASMLIMKTNIVPCV